MRNIIFLALLLMFISSCDNEVQLNAPFKDIPVVYGLLSLSDTAHYVRIEKAFLVENENALELARDPGQLYYENIDVQFIKENSGEVFSLERVEGSDEGYTRDDGVFAEQPNYLYKIKQDDILLDESDRIRLEIHRGEGFDPVTAVSPVIGEMNINLPNPDFQIAFRENAQTRFRWSEMDNASFYAIKLYVKYLESNTNESGDFVEKVLEWPLRDKVNDNSYNADGINFFVFLANSLEKGDNFKRILSKIDVRIDAGGLELQKYIEQGLVNIGITGSQEIDAYTNLSEGVGVFSTRNTIHNKNYSITQTTRDSLLDGRFTKDLNFE